MTAYEFETELEKRGSGHIVYSVKRKGLYVGTLILTDPYDHPDAEIANLEAY